MNGLAVAEIKVKSLLTPSRISGIDYSLNPYRGCAHGCRYCYASFMQRFSGHAEPWGGFVDVKINAPELLAMELRRKRPGAVGMSLVTDPYQPLEARYRLTRRCLEAMLAAEGFSLSLLTRSPLVVRDLDLLRRLPSVEAGLSITTSDDAIRHVFEPDAPPIAARIEALRQLKAAGLRTYAFAGPALPMNPERLARQLSGLVDYIWLDRLNYSWKVERLCRARGWEYILQPAWFQEVCHVMKKILEPAGAVCRIAAGGEKPRE